MNARKILRVALAATGTLGVNIMAHTLVPPYLNTLSKIVCEVTITMLTIGTYEVMANKAEDLIKDIEGLVDGTTTVRII